MTQMARTESRASIRHRRSDAVLWSFGTSKTSQMGWLLESSQHGCAFACRGAVIPNEDSLVSVTVVVAGGRPVRRSARVKRVTVAHSDLAVIAVRYALPRAQRVFAASAEVEDPRRPCAYADAA